MSVIVVVCVLNLEVLKNFNILFLFTIFYLYSFVITVTIKKKKICNLLLYYILTFQNNISKKIIAKCPIIKNAT